MMYPPETADCLPGPRAAQYFSYLILIPPTLLVDCRVIEMIVGFSQLSIFIGSTRSLYTGKPAITANAAGIYEEIQTNNVSCKEMEMNLYVGNLALNVSEGELQQAFEPFGEVTSVKIIKDKYTGESKGFGFVEMPSGAEAQAAMNGLNGQRDEGAGN